jgi:hypothetical protein
MLLKMTQDCCLASQTHTRYFSGTFAEQTEIDRVEDEGKVGALDAVATVLQQIQRAEIVMSGT